MVTQNKLREHKGKSDFLDNKKSICDCCESKQMPYTEQIPQISPHVRTYF